MLLCILTNGLRGQKVTRLEKKGRIMAHFERGEGERDQLEEYRDGEGQAPY
jgi:hypothetical protein